MHLWDKARKTGNRPSIYAPPSTSLLLRRALTKDPALQKDEFSKYFRDFVVLGKPDKELDLGELHRCISLACYGSQEVRFFLYVNMVDDRHKNLFIDLLANLLILRKLYLEFDQDEEQATNFALDQAPFLCYEKALPLIFTTRPDLFSHSVHAISHQLHRNQRLAPQEILLIQKSVVNTLVSYKNYTPASRVESEVELPFAVLEAFVSRVRAKLNAGILVYPSFECRLVGILSSDLSNSYGVFWPYSYGTSAQPSFAGVYDPPTPSKSAIAVIAMYPWEADHIEKACEMKKRGVPVAEPLGKLFVDEFEFGLFRWIEGKRLDGISNQKIWQDFGRTIRFCNSRGIITGDAAGRNAIYTPEVYPFGITLLDFERTYFKEGVPPSRKECRGPFLRVTSELNQEKRHKERRAFVRGYNQE